MKEGLQMQVREGTFLFCFVFNPDFPLGLKRINFTERFFFSGKGMCSQ